MNRTRLVVASLCALALVWPLGPARASHEDGYYEIPARAYWDSGDFSVLIVPPAHGQIFNADTGVLGGGDPNELTPFNSYLRAIEDSVAGWTSAVQQFGSETLKARFAPEVYVLGRDDVPPEVLLVPDILITATDQSAGPGLGVAIGTGATCVVSNSQFFILSFTYADMYNVNGQEYGHCLGLGHVGDQGGVDPLADTQHPEHDVMNGFYTHPVGDKGTHLHCVSNLDIRGLEFAFNTAGGQRPSSIFVTMPVSEYAVAFC